LALVNVIPRPSIKLEYTSKGPEPGGTLNNGATVKLFVNGGAWRPARGGL
jgi:hypothetical protein